MKIYNDELVVVTGGAGLIGSSVIRHLNDLGTNNIVVVDDLGKTEKWKNLVGKSFVDIISKEHVFKWLVEKESIIKSIIHLGACSSTLETDGDFILENNYRFSVRLAEYALNYGIRFIYASSAATYGDGSLGFSDDHDQLQSLSPLNLYGFSKHLFDLWLKNQGVLNQVVGLKYFNVFGPNEFHKGRMASAIYHVLPMAKKEGLIRLFKSNDPANYPDGGQMRDFIYVKDVAKLTCGFLENSACGIFNIGRGQPNTWNELAHAIFKAIDLPVQIEYIDMPKDLAGKYQNYTSADMKKTVQAFKEPLQFVPFEEAVVDYVRNYLEPGKRW